MFFKKNKCPNCGEVLDDDCYCFNCGTAIHNDNHLNDCKGTSHKKITYTESSNKDYSSENKEYLNTINNEPILYSVNVTNQGNSFLTFIISLFISGFILFGISFIFYLLVFSSSIIFTIIDSDISYTMDYISLIYSNNISIIYSIIFFVCFVRNYRKSNKSKKWVRTLHYLGYIADNKVKTVYNIDEISKFYINGNTICFCSGTKTVQMLTDTNAEEILDKLTYY